MILNCIRVHLLRDIIYKQYRITSRKFHIHPLPTQTAAKAVNQSQFYRKVLVEVEYSGCMGRI